MKQRMDKRGLIAAVMVGAAMMLVAADAGAQAPANNMFQQGMSKNKGEPVKIQAASLEVRDKDKMATFSGDVHVVQGDTDLHCQTLIVYYEGNSALGGSADAPKAPPPAKGAKAPPSAPQPGPQAAPGGQQQIRRMEAKGNVVVNQKDQTVTGDRADFDMRANTLTLTGKVVVTKGLDVLRGEKLFVNLTDGVSKMDSGGGRVEGLIQSTGAGRDKNPLARPATPK